MESKLDNISFDESIQVGLNKKQSKLDDDYEENKSDEDNGDEDQESFSGSEKDYIIKGEDMIVSIK